MKRGINRRRFLRGGVVAAGAGLMASTGSVASGASFGIIPSRVHPAVVGSGNGFPYMAKALEDLAAGMDTLDVAVAAVNNVENDPNDTSVGYGGIPNEEGVVELDSSCMHGPTMNAGAVASIRNIKNPASVAKDVLWHTDHVLLVGEGALRFAKARGYKEEDLLTDRARKRWLSWKTKLNPNDDWLEPHQKRPDIGKGQKAGKRETGTINFDVCNAKGEVSGVTTTSGLAYKIPGRVGDSPIIGAGLYVDGTVGAAGSTGRGEAVISSCGAHTIVEGMRHGLHPKDACLLACKRVAEITKAPYLLREDGRPTFQVLFYAVDIKGRIGGASIYPSRYACGDAKGVRREATASLFER